MAIPQKYYLTAFIILPLIIAYFVFTKPTGPCIIPVQSTPFRAAYLVQDTAAAELKVTVVVQSGEADNTGDEGLAHYLEHLTWLSSIGTMTSDASRDTNAYTTQTTTAYWLKGRPAQLPEFMATLLRLFEPIRLDTKFAEDERGIVQREYAMRYSEDVIARANEAVDKALYAGTGYGRSVIGDPAAIANFSLEMAKSLHEATHQLSNAILVVSGNISEHDITSALKTVASSDEKGAPRPLPDLSHLPPGQMKQTFVDPSAPDQMIWKKLVTLDQPVSFELLQTRLNLLWDILNTNLEGGLAKPLRFDAFITSTFDMEMIALDESHFQFGFYAKPDASVTLSQMQIALEKALSASAATGISAETYNRVKERFDEDWKKPTDPQKQTEKLENYVIDHAADRIVPLDADHYWALPSTPDRAAINALLTKLAGPGRVSVAYIGKQEDF